MPKEIYEQWGTPEQHIIATNPEALIVSHIEFGEGIKVFLKGHQYPQKGIPTPEAISAINVVKRVLREGIGWGWWLIPFRRKTSLKAFLSICWPVVSPYILRYQFLSPTSQAVYDLLKEVDVQMAKIVAHVLEYDSAYKSRLQDLMTESSKEALVDRPIIEIKRLLELNRQRDYDEIHTKLHKVGKLATLALLWPPFRKSFKKAISECDFNKLCFDKSDKYWICSKRDYNYMGLSYLERQELLKDVKMWV